MNLVSERYAEAIFEIAKDENLLLEYKRQAKELNSLITKDLIRFLSIKKVLKEEKKACLREWFKDYPLMFIRLMCLLVDCNRTNYINDILKCFISKCNEALNIKEVKVYTARPLNDASKNEIISAIKNKYKVDVELVEIIDEKLLAGIKINIDGKVIDTSLRNRIDSMKKELLKESW